MRNTTYGAAMCAGALVASAIAAAAADFTLKVGYSNREDPEHPAWAGLLVMEEYIERDSDGRIDVRLFPDGQLGKGQAVLEQVKAGAIEMTYANDGNINQVYPNLQVFSIPYLFADRSVAHKVLDGDFGQSLMQDMAETTGLQVFAWSENGGFRHFTNNVRPIRTPSDMKGLKLRVQNIPLHLEMVKNLGASPTPIAWKELYTALQTGVVDGQENPVNTFRIPRLEEVQKYMVLDGHVYAISAAVFNRDWVASLPEDLQTVVRDGTIAGQAKTREMILGYEEESLAYLKDYGLEIYEPTPEEKDLFREATKEPAIAWLKDNITRGDLVDGVLTEVARAAR